MTSLLIVSHGHPSDPQPAEKDLCLFSQVIVKYLPGWKVSSATLAQEGALEQSLAVLGKAGLVYPMFMAKGWFVEKYLPERLLQAGLNLAQDEWEILEPFGCDPLVHQLALSIVKDSGLEPGGELLLAAHGSFRSNAPAEIVVKLASFIKRKLGLKRCEAAFIDQPPKISKANGFGDSSVCLPFFAAQGEHVLEDLPKALEQAGFLGKILPALGCDPMAAHIVANRCHEAFTAQTHNH